MKMLALIIPLAFALLRLHTGKYIFSALVTISCGAIAALLGEFPRGYMLIAGFALSVAGDYFLAHPGEGSRNFLLGVGGFFLAHAAFCAFAAGRFALSPAALVFSAALLTGCGLYLWLGVLPAVERTIRPALMAYMGISVLGMFLALSMRAPVAEKWLYAAGIAAIVFSDIMIAEADFLHRRWAKALILPTYYLCHILLCASQLAG